MLEKLDAFLRTTPKSSLKALIAEVSELTFEGSTVDDYITRFHEQYTLGVDGMPVLDQMTAPTRTKNRFAVKGNENWVVRSASKWVSDLSPAHFAFIAKENPFKSKKKKKIRGLIKSR